MDRESAEAAGVRFGRRLVQIAHGLLLACGLIFLIILFSHAFD